MVVTAGLNTAEAGALDVATQALPPALSPTLQSVMTETSTTVRTVFAATLNLQTKQKLAAPQGDTPAFSLRSPYGSAGQLTRVAGLAPPADATSPLATEVETRPRVPGPSRRCWCGSPRRARPRRTSRSATASASATGRSAPRRRSRCRSRGSSRRPGPQDPYWTDPDGAKTSLAAPRLATSRTPPTTTPSPS